PLPGQHADGDRQREGNDHEAANQLLALEILQQQEGQRRTEQTLEDGRHHEEDHAVAEGEPEQVHLPRGAEVLDADEVRDRVADAGVADREVEREEERRGDKQQHVERCGREQRVAEHQPAWAVAQPRSRDGRYRHNGGPGHRVRAAAKRALRHARLCLAKIRWYSPIPHFMTSSIAWPRATRVNMSGRTKRLTTSWIGVVNG